MPKVPTRVLLVPKSTGIFIDNRKACACSTNFPSGKDFKRRRNLKAKTKTNRAE